MDSLYVEIKNCYGIQKLEHTFGLKACQTVSIYAPNGTMKTSFAKTLRARANGEHPRDEAFPDRESSCHLVDHFGNEVDPNCILVIEPYKEDYASENESRLLVDAGLKANYDRALTRISESLKQLMDELSIASGLKGESLRRELEGFYSKPLVELLTDLKIAVEADTDDSLAHIQYGRLFTPDSVKLLESGAIAPELHEYVTQYNKLLSESVYLTRSFNPASAAGVAKQLHTSGFFEAHHEVRLGAGGGGLNVASQKEFEKALDDEKVRIISDPELVKTLGKIDSKISNASLRAFREYIVDHPEVVPELVDIEGLRQKLWIHYLRMCADSYNRVLEVIENSSHEIRSAVSAANEQSTEWHKVVDLFNDRFIVPFTLTIQNQSEAVLGISAPLIAFDFKHGENEVRLSHDQLVGILSQGERRALYLLNILFELESRRGKPDVTVVVADDVADSFDYKNKYAIIEYLREIHTDPSFRLIVLTHNFDFHRSSSSRLGTRPENRFIAIRTDEKVILEQETYHKNPFDEWRKNCHDLKCAIALIPLVRNLAEFAGNAPIFAMLTDLLHIKGTTHSITFLQLENAFNQILLQKVDLSIHDHNKPVIEALYALASQYSTETTETAELASKIVLAIGARLLAEEHMIDEINDPVFVGRIRRNQTWALSDEYRARSCGTPEKYAVIKRINLITPEHIHLNSFMFEPLIDVSPIALRKLYSQAEQL